MIYHSKDQKPHSYNLISSISPAENYILPKQLERKRNLKQTMDMVKKKKKKGPITRGFKVWNSKNP